MSDKFNNPQQIAQQNTMVPNQQPIPQQMSQQQRMMSNQPPPQINQQMVPSSQMQVRLMPPPNMPMGMPVQRQQIYTQHMPLMNNNQMPDNLRKFSINLFKIKFF